MIIGDIFIVTGDRTIEEDVPLELTEEVTTIKGCGTLTLISTESRQPCIGSRTHTGMSYGRWTPTECTCKKLIIDGVNVICSTRTLNFSIGAYNYEEIPEIVYLNGGSLSCVETEHVRVLKFKAYPPEGSTKISGDPVYVLADVTGVLDEEQKDLIQQIVSINPNMVSQCNYHASSEFLNEALSLLKLKPDLDVTYLVCGEYEKSKMIARCML